MEALFWSSLLGVIYTYLGYPGLLFLWGRMFPAEVSAEADAEPSVTLVLPVHNEEKNLPAKLDNLLSLDYPGEKLQIIVVSDGSTDGTVALARSRASSDRRLEVHVLEGRGGKGKALEHGVRAARHPIVVFTDAGIILEPASLRALVRPFSDPSVGCVSGEDVIEALGGEGLYGRYELFLRRLESRFHSIVGASGSYYAQRRELCPQFIPGIAPDLLSVLHTVDCGFRALSEPGARGSMQAVARRSDEFKRKVRTLVRGMAGVWSYRRLLNPFSSGRFAFLLFSHKVLRWSVPFFLIGIAISNLALANQVPYSWLLWPHGAIYALALASMASLPVIGSSLPARIAAYFVMVNVSILAAWWGFVSGDRPEIWTPSKR